MNPITMLAIQFLSLINYETVKFFGNEKFEFKNNIII